MRRFGSPGVVALAVLSVVTVVLLGFAIQKQNALVSSPPGAPLGQSVPTQPSVVFVGDGWTSGAPPGGLGPRNYTALLAERAGWRVTNTAAYGAGYLAGVPLAGQVGRAVDARPQLVVVSAGRADLDQDPGAVRDAAGRLYRDLRTRLPRSGVVVIGPMWIGEDPPPEMSRVRDAIRDAAAAEQLPFVDPIEQRWFDGRDTDGTTPDGRDLNDRGHRRLAELVGDALRDTGALPP